VVVGYRHDDLVACPGAVVAKRSRPHRDIGDEFVERDLTAVSTLTAGSRRAACAASATIGVGDAAGAGAAIAHQVHGAMGFTYEHTLHHSTRRLWGWREEFGNETLWAERLGRMVAAQGADALWPFVTQGS